MATKALAPLADVAIQNEGSRSCSMRRRSAACCAQDGVLLEPLRLALRNVKQSERTSASENVAG